MSRSKSPRSSLRSLCFNSGKIRAFGKACRLARQYFHGGKPSEKVERREDDPNYQDGWNLRLSDVEFYTGIPTASVSELENYTEFRISLDTAASLLWYYGNSRNGHLLKPWVRLAVESVAFLSPNQDLIKRSRTAGYKPITQILEELRD